MKSIFEIAGGSISGRSHRLTGKNNQDALMLFSRKRLHCGRCLR